MPSSENRIFTPGSCVERNWAILEVTRKGRRKGVIGGSKSQNLWSEKG